MPTDEWIVLMVLAVVGLLLLILVIWEPAYWAYRAWRLKRAFHLRDRADKAAYGSANRSCSHTRSSKCSRKATGG